MGYRLASAAQDRGLAAAGAAGDEDVESAPDRAFDELDDLWREGATAKEIVLGEHRFRIGPERHASAEHGGRCECRVDAGPVLEASIDVPPLLQGALLVEPVGDYPDELDQILFARPNGVGPDQAARSFDPDVAVGVDHDFGH